MKRFLLLLLCIVFAVSAAACAGEDTGMQGDAYLLTIYRSRDTGMTDGSRDDAVRQAIEDKFFQDTGIKIRLTVNLYTNEAITDIVDVNFSNRSKNMEGIVHYLSEDRGSAITKYAKDATATKDLDPILSEHGSVVLQKLQQNDTGNLADRAGYFNYNGEYYRTALTSFAKEGGYGLIMRKDLMRSVQQYTGLNPDEYDITNENFKSMTLTEFETVMAAIKQHTDVTTPVNGKPWDLGRVIAPSFGVDTLNWGFDEDGNYVPSQYTPGWDKYVDLMYRWARDGIWEKESNNTTDDQRVTNLIAGRSAAYLAYPTAEQLITVAKKFYAANTSGELMAIAPLASEDAEGNSLYNTDGTQVVNGNLKTARGFYAMVVPYRALNTEVLIKYMNWMYSSPENYELCLYGVKGEDWVDGDDFSYNGVTYKTWAYPAAKSDEYLIRPPYTGKYCLVQNINVSNRISAHYSTVEKTWYTSYYYDFPTFSISQVEGIWIPETPRQYASQANEVDGQYVDNIRSYAWVGLKNGGKTPTELLSEYITETKVTAAGYLEYVSNEFNRARDYFQNKYAQ